jgi:hypothetical protein
MMQALDKDLRGALEKTVKAARTVAEAAAQAAVHQLGVGHDKPEAYQGDAEKALRNRLRTHGKQLGDARDSKSTNPTYGKQEVQHLVQEVAYQHWHRMLFARFLADNNLLMYDGVAVTIEECDELAPDEGAKSGWELAGKLAARMLPQVFKPGSPVFELTFAPEHQSELERLLKDLPDAVFKASDSLGWVYQFWQADNKERINKSEVKIGADELPAVTQLFTEPYMVAFLLHNSLGAWWATRHPGKPCPVNLDYFRTLEDGTPAAGKFAGWPDSLADFKLLDPCCGSGHFLVAAFLMLVPMRMAAEGLSAREAVNRVLAENIHGLELDPRCVEIAVFAVAFEAWRYPDASGKPLGVREIPAPNIACCGLKVAARPQDWEALVPDEAPSAEYVRQELRQLHASFSKAPLLGSLLDPSKTLRRDMATSSHGSLTCLLRKALSTERASRAPDNDDRWELALCAQGLLEAARILDLRYHLVITNVPYLARGNQVEELRDYSATHYPNAKGDLANVFLERCIELSQPSGQGVVQIVMPQNWLFLTTYSKQRAELLTSVSWDLLVRLGPGAFQTISGEVVQAILLTQTNVRPTDKSALCGIDVSDERPAIQKANALRRADCVSVAQNDQLGNPDKVISFNNIASEALLASHATVNYGSKPGQTERIIRLFFEVPLPSPRWQYLESTPKGKADFTGKQKICFSFEEIERQGISEFGLRSADVLGKRGTLISQMNDLPAAVYLGYLFDNNTSAIVAKKPSEVAAIHTFLSSEHYAKAVRAVNRKMDVAANMMLKVRFDAAEWEQKAATMYPHGLPRAYSDDPTEWIFHGHPVPSSTPLQVAVARLVGYRWPAETDTQMALSKEGRKWIDHCRELPIDPDNDGIVCIPPIGGEPPASDRLLNLLAVAYGECWTNDVLAQLLKVGEHAGKSLETWLRDKFFTQHCALFGNRPFVWHVWDGLRDGFAALVNYHKLDYKALEALIYTYLGDWIGRQKRDADSGVDGAQEKLAAAEALKKRLELILAGESPYDIFVRWKPVEEQPIGWNPDLNDGVRLNIRPFLSVPDVGKKGAGVLRDKPKSLHWEKDRGSDAPSAPWYDLGFQYGGKVGDRINDHHLTLTEKRAARAKQGKA